MAAYRLKTLVQTPLYRITFLQLACILVIAIAVQLVQGQKEGASLFLGGLAYVLPSFLFIWGVCQFVRAQQMVLFVAAFFMGEALKLVLSAVLFLMIAKYLPVTLLFELIGYIAAIVSFWIMSAWELSVRGKNQIEEWLNE